MMVQPLLYSIIIILYSLEGTFTFIFFRLWSLEMCNGWSNKIKLSQLVSSPRSDNLQLLRLANNFKSLQIQSSWLATNLSGLHVAYT